MPLNNEHVSVLRHLAAGTDDVIVRLPDGTSLHLQVSMYGDVLEAKHRTALAW